MDALITGGAGLIGSHLAEALLDSGNAVTVLDSLSTGYLGNVSSCFERKAFRFVRGDCLEAKDVEKALRDCEVVFHLVGGWKNVFNTDVRATYTLLESIRKARSVKHLVFTSSAQVFGESKTLPTSEEASLRPIHPFAAAKMASEALIEAYSHLHGFRATVFRLCNIVGARSYHGVIRDFVERLERNQTELLVYGDGTQRRPYLLAEECVRGMITGCSAQSNKFDIYNLGPEDCIDVDSVAGIVLEEMGLQGVRIVHTGLNKGAGWPGDIRQMWLDVSKLEGLGWTPRFNSAESVRVTTRRMLANIGWKKDVHVDLEVSP